MLNKMKKMKGRKKVCLPGRGRGQSKVCLQQASAPQCSQRLWQHRLCESPWRWESSTEKQNTWYRSMTLKEQSIIMPCASPWRWESSTEKQNTWYRSMTLKEQSIIMPCASPWRWESSTEKQNAQYRSMTVKERSIIMMINNHG